MSIIGQNILAGASAAGEAYTIDQSLRFNDGDSGYLNKTGLSGGSTTKGTQSFWFKRSTISTDQRMWATYEGSSSTRTTIGFQAANKLHIQVGDSAVRISTQVFRDVGSWYHLVVGWDSTQAAAANRCRAYVNGVEITAWDTTSGPTEDGDMHINNGEIRIGQRYTSNLFFDGYIADFHSIDGTQYTASNFGETNLDTNQWVPKKFVGAYGSNGFNLNFSGDMGGYTQLLLHCDGANDGTTFTDSSENGFTVTATDVTTNTTTKELGTASAYFDGTDMNNLSVVDSSVWDIDFASSWTWEFWMNAVVPADGYAGIITHHDADAFSPGWGIVFDSAGTKLMLISTVSHASWTILSSVIPNGGWHHYAFVHDNDANTMKLWIDGALDTTGSTSAITLPGAAGPLIFGTHNTAARTFEGYLDEIRFSTTARYKAPFTVATAPFGDIFIGTDSSGNDNNFTVNNIGITAQTPDSTTNNFPTMNPLINPYTGFTYSDGNLQINKAANNYGQAASTFGLPNSGKWYWEINRSIASGTGFIGIAGSDANRFWNSQNTPYLDSVANILFYDNGQKYIDSTASAYGATWYDANIMAIALNLDDNEITLYKNNVSQGAATITGGILTADTIIPVDLIYGTEERDYNFGQNGTFNGNKPVPAGAAAPDDNDIGDFFYAPPSGFLAICTSNLADPAVALPGENFNTQLYTGTGSSNAITGVGFQPDTTWIKNRGTADDNIYVDAVRGANNYLVTNTTGSQVTNAQYVVSLDSDGFTVGTGTETNTNTENFVSWNWKAAGATTVTNDDGTIDSEVTANATAGYSIASYTGNGTSGATIGHGLSVTPQMVIIKRYDTAASWIVYSERVGAGAALMLDVSSAKYVYAQYFNNTAPTASVISLGNNNDVNGNTYTYISYSFHSVAGYSQIGYYTGNGLADGPIIYTGFQPAWVLKKAIAADANWHITDNARNPYNVMDLILAPNSTISDQGSWNMDFLSDGFKIRDTSATVNGDGSEYLYLAFAEWPFKYANAR